MDQTMQKLHDIEIDILKQTLAVIERHGLKYFMLGGTLLGAIRHKGFIPWDDDIDIGMPRTDYNRFIEIAGSELKNPYQIHTCMNEKGKYSYYFARIENIKIKLEKYATENKTVVPAWIDVFPLDNVPDDDNEIRKWYKK